MTIRILGAGAALVCLAWSATAQAVDDPVCSECLAAIRAQVTQGNEYALQTIQGVKANNRKLDLLLAVPAPAPAPAPTPKSAVLIDFGGGLTQPTLNSATNTNPGDALATTWCKTINYT